MAIIKAVNSGASLGRAIKYIEDRRKTQLNLMTGINCNPRTAIEEMKATKALWGKEDGRQYKHFVQSFAAGEITAGEAHKIAQEWANNQYFKGFEILISTHTDTENIHSHIIVNSVNFENGRKFQQSRLELQMLKNLNDELCRERGLSIPKPTRNITSKSNAQYRAIERGITGEYKSWQLDIMNAVTDVKGITTTRENFISKLQEKGITVNWQDSRKYITFTDSEGNKARNATLEKIFKEPLSKEVLENELSGNKERTNSDRTTRIDGKTERNGVRESTAKRGVSDIEREVRDVAGGVNSRTADGRREQAERLRKAERESRKDNEIEREFEKSVRQQDYGISR